MAISIDWATKVISVPQADLTHISGTLYELDTDAFRLELKDLEDDEVGMPFLDTHRHNTAVTVAGTTFARTVEIINGYSITFEDGQYTVKLVGSNNNIFDVENGILNQNQVQIIAGNSAGLIVSETTSGLTIEESTQLDEIHSTLPGIESDIDTLQVDTELVHKILRNKLVTDPDTGMLTIYDDDGVSILYQGQIWEDVAKTIAYRSQGIEVREKLTAP